MKVIPLVRPFPVLTPFTYGSQGAERMPNDKEYIHEMLMEYVALPNLLKKFTNESDTSRKEYLFL